MIARQVALGQPVLKIDEHTGAEAVDLVIADSPVMPSLKVRTFSHLLGETGVSVPMEPTGWMLFCAIGPILMRRSSKL